MFFISEKVNSKSEYPVVRYPIYSAATKSHRKANQTPPLHVFLDV